jgi:hypothetical protein
MRAARRRSFGVGREDRTEGAHHHIEEALLAATALMKSENNGHDAEAATLMGRAFENGS